MAGHHNGFGYACWISKYFAGGKPHHSITLRFQMRIPNDIMVGPGSKVMDEAIHLDYRFGGIAIKIRHQISDGMLLAEFQSCRPALKQLPQEHFRERHLPAQAPRSAQSGRRVVAHLLNPLHRASHGPPPPMGEDQGRRYAPPPTFCAISTAFPSGSV